jgi:hypothetical protein
MTSRSVTFRYIVLAALAAAAAQDARADSTRFGLDADIVHDSNVSRGPSGPDEKADNILSAEAYAARSLLLGARSGLVLRGGLKLSQYLAFRDLSNVALSGRAAWRIQPSPGYSAPWLEIAGSGAWLRHSDSDLRDGWIAGVTVGGGSYLTDRVRVGAGAGIEERSADEGTLYDLSTHRLWATLDYRVGISSTVYGSVTRIAGDHVFNAVYGPSKGRLASYADALAGDPSLAEEFGGVTPVGYRIDATTFVYELGLNLPLTGSQALDLSAAYFDSETDRGGLSYDGVALRAMYMIRFR